MSKARFLPQFLIAMAGVAGLCLLASPASAAAAVAGAQDHATFQVAHSVRGNRGFRGGRFHRGGRGFRGRGFRGRGFHGGGRYYGRGFGPRFHRRHWRGRGFRRGYYGGGFRGADAAALTLGIIGGAILIDAAFDDRRVDRGRFDDDRIRFRRPRGGDDFDYSRRRGDFDESFDFDAPDGAAREGEFDNEELLGGEPVERRFNPADRDFVEVAFRECLAETRGAARAGGFRTAMPDRPLEVADIDNDGVRMTARFRATNARGESWIRWMTCEADARGVTYLEVA